jgi:hypothetical protein
MEQSGNIYEPNAWKYEHAYVCSATNTTADEKAAAQSKLETRMDDWWTRFRTVGAVFVHIPKNAGTSIEFILGAKVPQSQHFTAYELRTRCPELYKSLPSFAIVRDPILRAKSAYNYLASGGNGGPMDSRWMSVFQTECPTFDSFVSKKLLPAFENNAWYNVPHHCVPQYFFLCDLNDGSLLVDALVTTDSLHDRGVDAIMDRLPNVILSREQVTQTLPNLTPKCHNLTRIFTPQIPRLRSSPSPGPNQESAQKLDPLLEAITIKHLETIYERDFYIHQVAVSGEVATSPTWCTSTRGFFKTAELFQDRFAVPGYVTL